jgi:urea carboxylase-associated protein 2
MTPRPLRLATYNVEWFNALFDDRGRMLEDQQPSTRYRISRGEQLGALGIVFSAMDADGITIIEAPDTNGRRSTVRALESFARGCGLRARKALIGFPSETEQEIAFLYDPDRLSARHDPRGHSATSHGAKEAPRFDTAFRYDLDADNILETIRFSKPPLELAVATSGGTRLRLIDRDGDACASLQLFNAAMPTERLNIADTVKVQWNAYPGQGSLLLSDMGRVMVSIEADEAGTHDAFCGPSTAASLQRRGVDGRNSGTMPNARDRLLLGAAKHGLGRRDVHPCLNLFKGVRIAEDGAVEPQIGPFAPGRTVVLRAEMDLIVVLANCPHVLDPRPWHVTPLRATAWRGPVTAEGDPIRSATPEGLRAFLNTEDLYR